MRALVQFSVFSFKCFSMVAERTLLDDRVQKICVYFCKLSRLFNARVCSN